ncbi:hypothetical protein L917_04189, partial [Phytophthora nicotianae]
MDDSWEPRTVLVADVPDCVAPYKATLGAVPSFVETPTVAADEMLFN